jgi:hypothetical protein
MQPHPFVVLALLAVVSQLGAPAVMAQDAAPMARGDVTIDPGTGAMRGRVCLTDMRADARPRFLLNAALNVRETTTTDGTPLTYRGDFDGRMVGEAREYILESPPGEWIAGYCVAFQGAVAVFDSNTAQSDWKGRIAAYRGTVRAAEQARWIPTPVDSVTAVPTDAMRFDLGVSCATCRFIYVNGTSPARGPVARFTSDTPRGVLLYAGDISATETAAGLFIGTNASTTATTAFGADISGIAATYERMIGIPYAERPAFLTFTAVSRNHQPGVPSWMFVTWPTIAISGGLPFDSLVTTEDGRLRMAGGIRPTLAHEMAHYYFGTRWVPHGPLRWIGLESTAEWMALRATKELEGDATWARQLLSHLGELGENTTLSLPALSAAATVSGVERYRLTPLAFVLVDAEVGTERGSAFLRHLLALPPELPATAERFQAAAAAAGIADSTVRRYFSAPVDVKPGVIALARASLMRARRDVVERPAFDLLTQLMNQDTSDAGRALLRRVIGDWLRIPGNQPAVLYQSGKLAAVSGRDLSLGETHLRRYLELPVGDGQPSHAAAHYRLGEIRLRCGDIRGAREALTRAIALDATLAAARRALDGLPAESSTASSCRR